MGYKSKVADLEFAKIVEESLSIAEVIKKCNWRELRDYKK